MVHRPSSLTPNQTFYPCRSEWNHRPCLLPSRKADCCYYCFAVSVFYATSNGTANDWFFTGSYTDFRSALDNVSTKPRRIFHPPFSALDWSTVRLPTANWNKRTGINATKFKKTPIHFKSGVFAAIAVVDVKSPLWYPNTPETMRDVFCFVLSSPLTVICSHKLFPYWLNFQSRWVWIFLLWLLILIMGTAGRRDFVYFTKQAGFII